MSTLSPVELGVLGPIQVRQDGAPVGIPGAKPRAILTMLGLHCGSVVSADTLVGLLWGDDPPRTAAKALQTHISSLRRTLGDGFVLTEGAGWTLADSEVDAARYKVVARLGRDAVAVGDTSQALAHFEEARALWRGIPELPDNRRGTSEKTRWVEGHAALVEDRADALLATGRAAEIIGELEAAVADAPLRERRWGQLMLALYRAGRQGDALAAYQRARALLADELGIDPGPELRRLETAIVAQDSALEVVAAQNLPSVMRAVTFLLTDIEGSTAAWEADADAMALALARHDELVEQVVTSRGGRLIKTRGEGDATFSVFERPSAAAAAAIELQDAIVHEPWTLRAPIRIRVALHTGEVELRGGDYFGRAVNRAARLRSLALGGQILCSGATAELVIDSLPDDVMLADLGLRELRNLARPEHVFELRLETAEDHPQPPASDAPMERPSLPPVLIGAGPFVGRGLELERLLSAWQTALGGGARAALIAGEPGVGKTRLAGEWSRQAYEQGAVVLYGRCDEDLGAPYQPFAEALRSLVPCVGTSRLRGLRGVEALLPLVPGLVDDVPDLAAPTRADPDTERYALFDAVVALVEMASTEAPVVLVLDDLHWAAKPTLLLLRHLLRFGDRARVQIVGTYRSTDLDRSHPLAAMLADLHRDGTANRISLSGLDEDDVSAYVAKAGYDDEELGHALASVTGGNPFFLIEALRHVDESGGVWDPSTLPQGVREAVSRRLSRLPIETNKALAAAAVVGSRFALDLVERVVGDDLVDAFDEASKAGIVIEEPGGRYRFNHAIVRQSLLAELPSMRRMRLHQRIATTLEDEPGADDELLAELAHHYFECAWAGNAAKAVEYCRRAADQAMARLAYEGAAELYDHALHALEELDDELPDRDDQIADLLPARCEALLAAGDVTSAAGAVSQLQQATVDSARLSAWATCFDGQLSVLVHPERLDDVEAALGAAAQKLAEIDDAAGEAKAHTVRATCLARLGRVGDCEIALDDALAAARRARDHRRVNAVLAGAPLAALWGPNPVPRAGGRCLDVVRLLRITTDSPAVEATSTRCQAVLEAFRGRDAAARRMIDSARRTVTELGLRHALLEVEQFAGIVELVLDDPAAAEPHLRQAYNGFRRMGLDADTAETAALLGRACLALNRDAEADELCTESERLAGHALKASIAWRTVRAQLLSRGNDHEEARSVAQAAVTLAERTDGLVDHGDACLSLAMVLGAAGDAAGARAAAERAASLYERKGAAALAEKARRMLDERPAPVAPREAPSVELTNACVQAGSRLIDAVNCEAWDEVKQLLARYVSVESRRKIVGFARSDVPSSQWPQDMRGYLQTGMVRYRGTPLAVRGERLALFRLEIGTADLSSGAPQDEMLQVAGIDEEGRIALQVKFDVEDMDAALAELDAVHARIQEERSQARRLFGGRELPSPPASPQMPTADPDTACIRAIGRLDTAVHRGAWGEVEQLVASSISVENRRKIVGFPRVHFPSSEYASQARLYHEIGPVRHRRTIVAKRGERVALTRLKLGTADVNPGAPQDEALQLFGLDKDGRIAMEVWFDVEDMDAALAELDALHERFEDERSQARRLENAASQVSERLRAFFAARDWAAIADILADGVDTDDRRRVLNAGLQKGRDAAIENFRLGADLGVTHATSNTIATRGERLVLARARYSHSEEKPQAFNADILSIYEIDSDERIAALITFDADDFDAAIAELDARYLAGEAAAHSDTWSVISQAYAALNRHEFPATAPDWINIDHRGETAFGPDDLIAYIRAGLDLDQDVKTYVAAVHRLSHLGVVVTYAAHETSKEGFDAEWRGVTMFTIEGDMVNRSEIFDEADLDTAIATFEQLSRPAPRLENTASHVYERFQACFAARDWAALADITADDCYSDDRRRVVNGGVIGRGAVIESFRTGADLGLTHATSDTIATRGGRLVLTRDRYWRGDENPEALSLDLLQIVEIDREERISAFVTLDPDDFETAIAELESRYITGEAAAHARTWSAVLRPYTAINRQELLATTADWVNIDHRRGATFAPGDANAYVRASLDDGEGSISVETVHRLGDLGAVVTWAATGTTQEGFDAEWRGIHVLTVDRDLISRFEVFDEVDIDTAIARFDQLSRPAPRLENAASQAVERYSAYFAARDWDALAKVLADDISIDDRRRVVNAGIRQGRDAEIANLRATADAGFMYITSVVIAARGERLILTRTAGRDRGSEEFLSDALGVLEINSHNQIAAIVIFDLEDFDAAIAELDARYLAGEAAAHAHTWSPVAASYTALNRHELPLTTPDCVNIDHRRETAFGPGDLIPYLRAGLDLDQHINIYVETVHRLTGPGAVVTYAAHETSQEGFDAEWRGIAVFTVEGDMINRTEVFDEADLDAAIASFDELSRPVRRLENTASRANARFVACATARDWDGIASILADDHYSDDRRRVTGAGTRRGRDADIEHLQVLTELGATITVEVIATRGDRLILTRTRVSFDQQQQGFLAEALTLIETDLDGRIAAVIAFDLEDIEAAFQELDARYLAGEAAAHGDTWSVITGSYAAFNRHEVPAADWVTIDHRQSTPFEPDNMTPSVRTIWDLTPDLSIHIEAVHRLNNFGAVITHEGNGTSQEGFHAEWRAVDLLTVDGDLIIRCEVFDEADLDAAIARFDQLSRSAQRLGNAASQVGERILALFATRDWDAMAEILADRFSNDDRRRVVGAGVRHGRDAEIANTRTTADLWTTNVTPTVTATRGRSLVLTRLGFSGRDDGPEPFLTEVLSVLEINDAERMVALVTFDLEDFDAAIAELDARYLAGEAGAHAHVWSVIAGGFASMRRYELPPTTPDCVSIDHRRTAAFAPGELNAYFRAAFDLTADVKIYVEAVHRLNDLGVVCTHVVHGVSHEGFAAEWREVDVLMVEGNVVNRCEIFDEADLDAALARFDELDSQTPRRENTASQVAVRFLAHLVAGDWDAIAATLADDFSQDDRRRVVGAGVRQGRDAEIADLRAIADLSITNVTSTVIATRGERLALMRVRFSFRDQGPEAFLGELLAICEINADEQLVADVSFDLDEIDAAIAELDARYLAGEAAAHSHTWSVISQAYAALNRRALPATTRDWTSVDHRHFGTIETDALTPNIRAFWDLTSEARIDVATVHGLTNLGAVVAHTTHATSQEGVEIESGEIIILMVDGDLLSRCEIFNEADLDAALARFDELQPHAPRLEHPVQERFLAHFAARDWDAMGQDFADDYYCDDRRRVVNAGVRHGRDAAFEDLRVAAEIGLMTNIMSAIVATRGKRLFLGRARWLGPDQRPEDFYTEVLYVVEIDPEERIAAQVVFDFDDIAAAFAELDARYLADEAAEQRRTWSAIAGMYASFNRHELPATTPDWVTVDRRPVATFEFRDASEFFRSTWDLTPHVRIYAEAVHRLTSLGAVVTHVVHATSEDGFDAEWRISSIVTVKGDLISGCELFDEADLDAALATFEELSHQVRRLENAATGVQRRLESYFAARDWDAMAETLVADISMDDRRRVVGAGRRQGRDAVIAELSALAEMGVTSMTPDLIAIRGGHLVLSRVRNSGRDQRPDAFRTDVLDVLEVDADGLVVARVVFDPDDIAAAFNELDARYLAGEAAAHSHTWSLVTDAFAAINRHELPERTPAWVNVDHRRGAAFAAGEMTAYIDDLFDDVPDIHVYAEVVHRLGNLGAVITQAGHGTSQEGFQAEWREIGIFMFDGDLLSHYELFDHADLDAALARFDELHSQAARLENAASQVEQRFLAYFAARDWDAYAEILSDDVCIDDRRHVVNAGVRHGRDAEIANVRALADIGVRSATSTVIAVRGGRLFLGRHGVWGGWSDSEASETLCVLEINAENQIVARVLFDADDIDAAFAELDARYLAGEAADHAHLWTAMAKVQAAYNRHEVPPATTDCVNIDHRRGRAFVPGDVIPWIRATYDVAPNVKGHLEAVHRLDNLGVVVTEIVTGTSQEGFGFEWREVTLVAFEGEMVSRFEIFDEADLDAALARFDELQPQAPRLENAASQVDQGFWTHFGARDWDAMADLLADDISTEDRRRVVNAGVRHGRDSHIAEMRAVVEVGTENVAVTVMATRGARLALTRIRASNSGIGVGELSAEVLNIVEINADNQILSRIGFDTDDIDAAFEELDARYMVGEAAAHARTWSVVASSFATFNRHEVPAADWVTIDHRQGTPFEPSNMTPSIRTIWDLTPNLSIHIEAVHRLNNFGAVITHEGHGTSQHGFDAEWRAVDILMVDGDSIIRCEVFDEADLDAALGRFE